MAGYDRDYDTLESISVEVFLAMSPLSPEGLAKKEG